MSIIESDIVRALKSESWFNLDDLPIESLPAKAVRDLDFGDSDCSVFFLPEMDWSENNSELDTLLGKVIIRLLFSSIKFHQPRIVLFKLDKELFTKENFEFLDGHCGIDHYDLVGATFGSMKKMVESAYLAIRSDDQTKVRSYGIKDIRAVLASFSFDELKGLFRALNACSNEKEEKRAEGIIGRIQNVYYKKNKNECPIQISFLS